MEQTAKGAAPFAELFNQLPIHRMPGLFELAVIEQADQGPEFVCKTILVLGGERRAADRLNSKKVHDLFPAQTGAQLGPLAPSFSVCRLRCWTGNWHLGERINLPFLDVQPECRQQSADGREFGKIVIGDDSQIEVSVTTIEDRAFAKMLRGQFCCQSDMLRDRLQRNPAEIVVVHSGDEITKHIRRHVRTKRGESLLEVFAVGKGHGGVSISQDRSLCAIWADSIMPRRQAGETGR